MLYGNMAGDEVEAGGRWAENGEVAVVWAFRTGRHEGDGERELETEWRGISERQPTGVVDRHSHGAGTEGATGEHREKRFGDTDHSGSV